MKRILIANRGEIALRVQKTLLRLGVEPVSIYHSDEEGCLHARSTNISVNLGNGSLRETYLNIPLIIGIAKKYNCDAIHPGYGFLSENYEFALACEENQILFIGPHSNAIKQMGLKSQARFIAVKAGVPVLNSIIYEPEFDPAIHGLEYPLLIKAVAGGGGKGMRIVRKADDFELMVKSAKRESLQYFNNDELLVEPYLENARHIEVQILGDNHGNIIHLYERECSLQRNHQKIIEEAPALSISESLRAKLHNAAISFARELHYRNAGTVEFLVQGEHFYFLEMNTRIQVEHPVTEMITGIDLVEEQIRVARGDQLPSRLEQLQVKGHAIEARLYAENPYQSFMASTGEVSMVSFPDDVRVDTFIEKGAQITSHFDSLLGKIIVHASSRNRAVQAMSDALAHTHIHGINTNKPYLKQIVTDQAFRDNHISTLFLEQTLNKYSKQCNEEKKSIDRKAILLAFVYNHFLRRLLKPENLWEAIGPNAFLPQFKVYIDGVEKLIKIVRNNEILVDGESLFFEVIQESEYFLSINCQGVVSKVYYSASPNKTFDTYELDGFVFRVASPVILQMSGEYLAKRKLKSEKKSNQIVSPLFGRIIDINVKENDKVKKGDVLLTIESMKTENQILAPGEGIVLAVLVKKGLQVQENKELITLNSGI